ncbi:MULTISPECIES: phage tail-collar fiber domain-containing protein [Agrobacterium tumefaciens complex]|uniref:phage tail-collar fiber domain-containing protein n=1 Tax=Agrobacterium tumefaciens complex TaxID=1183400 RepID=UPI001CD98C24|nr:MULTISPECIES: phage tail protein [Agrobacterium tumefaciens complex]
MAQAYFSLVTNTGKIKLAQSAAGGGPVAITHFAIGDGNGAETNPTAASTALVREVWRTAIESVVTDPDNPSAILVTAIIPTNTGGWWMREFGIFDQAGAMIAVAKPVSQYKPTALEGQLEDIRYEFQIIIGENAEVTLLVDPSLLFATRAWVENRRISMGQFMRLPWMPVLSMTLSSPPGNPALGDTYRVPSNATGIWAANIGKLAEWNGTGWNYITPPDGHGISLPDGRVFERIAGSYVEKLALDVQSGKWTYAQADGTANDLTATLSPSPLSYAHLRMVLINATQANTRAVVTININGLGARNIVRKGGGALRRGDIQPGPMLLLDNGTAYELIGTTGLYRTPLVANLDLYVAATGLDTNDGLSAAAPFKTLQRAWSEIVNNYDLNGRVVTVNVADGNYDNGFSATSAPLGGNAGTGAVVFKSSSGNATAVVISKTGGGNVFYAQGGAQFTIKDMTVQCSGTNGNAVVTGVGGAIAYDGLRFGACTLSHVNASNGGFIQATGNYTVFGSAAYHIVASAAGQIINAGRTVTITGTPAFTAWAFCSQGRIDSTATTYVGGATGSRFFIDQNGVITVAGAGVNVMPGNAAGTQQLGGQYV